ncbi:unnamed protein product [Arctia plantaginis]|uniref:Uncharacterized protein n=1 Tax=Arctia plantaginis TaxID=874455 RepID=A0A8S1B7V1_ARCPL|nr:unnamed protein product [Arctia plantaginis]
MPQKISYKYGEQAKSTHSNECSFIAAQLAPRLVQQLHAAARRYPGWKALTDLPYHKPWIHPEQVPPHRISLADCVDPDAPPPPVEPKPDTSKSKLVVPQPREIESHSVEDLGDLSSEFSVEVEEDTVDHGHDPTKKKGKFYRLVKSMKNRRKKCPGSQECGQSGRETDGRTSREKEDVQVPQTFQSKQGKGGLSL